MHLPLVKAYWGRDILRGSGWAFGFRLAPFPVEEQRVGHLVKALLTVWVYVRAWRIEIGVTSDDRGGPRG